MESFVARYVPEVDRWYATCWFLPHIGAIGKTEEEAIDSLKDGVALWTEERIEELGDDIRIAASSRSLYAQA